MKDLLEYLGWFGKSIILAIIFGIFPIFITTLNTKGVKPEITLFWWMIGACIGIFILSKFGGFNLVTDNVKNFIYPTKYIILVLLLGTTLGLITNTFYGSALSESPNPAFVVCIVNGAVLITYISAPLLHKTSPKTFPESNFSIQGLIGILFVLLGVILISKQK